MQIPILATAVVPLMIFAHDRGRRREASGSLPHDSSHRKVVMSRRTWQNISLRSVGLMDILNS